MKQTKPKMAITSPLILSIFSILLLTTAPTTSSNPNYSIESFIHCFLEYSSTNSSHHQQQLLFTPNSTSYQSILQSSSQNYHFLLSPSYRKPAAIVTATSASHVAASLACARAHGIGLRTRSGGHDYEAMSYVSEGGQPFVVVDLAALRAINVNVARRRAWVQAGATIGELYYTVFTKSNGRLGFPAGTCPTVGVGGHFSGGGIGTLSRKYGMAADNVVDALVVDVDGRILNRTTMGKDLFWAIRGGGAASFGVVLAYKVRLVEVPPVVTAFNVYRNLKQNATKLVTRWQEIAPKFDKSLFIRVAAQRIAGDASEGGATIQAQFNSYFLGNRSELLSVMATSFPELGLKPEGCTEMNWLQSVLFFAGMPVDKPPQVLLNRTRQANASFKAKSDYVTQPISERGWEEIWRFLMDGEGEPMTMILDPYGGRMAEIADAATPFPHRKGNLYNIQYYLWWLEADPAVADRHLEWMRRLYGFMAPYVSSNPRAAYYNYKDVDLGRDYGEKYFKNNFERLVRVKAKVDPHNFFRNEQSIPPVFTQ